MSRGTAAVIAALTVFCCVVAAAPAVALAAEPVLLQREETNDPYRYSFENALEANLFGGIDGRVGAWPCTGKAASLREPLEAPPGPAPALGLPDGSATCPLDVWELSAEVKLVRTASGQLIRVGPQGPENVAELEFDADPTTAVDVVSGVGAVVAPALGEQATTVALRIDRDGRRGPELRVPSDSAISARAVGMRPDGTSVACWIEDFDDDTPEGRPFYAGNHRARCSTLPASGSRWGTPEIVARPDVIEESQLDDPAVSDGPEHLVDAAIGPDGRVVLVYQDSKLRLFVVRHDATPTSKPIPVGLAYRGLDAFAGTVVHTQDGAVTVIYEPGLPTDTDWDPEASGALVAAVIRRDGHVLGPAPLVAPDGYQLRNAYRTAPKLAATPLADDGIAVAWEVDSRSDSGPDAIAVSRKAADATLFDPAEITATAGQDLLNGLVLAQHGPLWLAMSSYARVEDQTTALTRAVPLPATAPPGPQAARGRSDKAAIDVGVRLTDADHRGLRIRAACRHAIGRCVGRLLVRVGRVAHGRTITLTRKAPNATINVRSHRLTAASRRRPVRTRISFTATDTTGRNASATALKIAR